MSSKTVVTKLGNEVVINRHDLTGNEVVSVCYHADHFKLIDGETVKTTSCEMDENLADVLPHGSGIDADWSIEITPTLIVLRNSFHCMDEFGGYCGWADFSVTIPKMILAQHWGNYFKLKFHGKDAQYLNQKIMLRDYLEQTIYEFLHTVYAYTIH